MAQLIKLIKLKNKIKGLNHVSQHYMNHLKKLFNEAVQTKNTVKLEKALKKVEQQRYCMLNTKETGVC